MSHYARGTTVPVEKSRFEIETIVKKYGATAFSYAIREDKAMLQFEARDRTVRFILPLPLKSEKRFGWKRRSKYVNNPTTPEQREQLWEQACRERWRALRIAILAKLESVEAGIETFEESFLAQIVDPTTNRTVYECIKQPLAISYSEHPQALRLEGPLEVEVVDDD